MPLFQLFESEPTKNGPAPQHRGVSSVYVTCTGTFISSNIIHVMVLLSGFGFGFRITKTPVRYRYWYSSISIFTLVLITETVHGSLVNKVHTRTETINCRYRYDTGMVRYRYRTGIIMQSFLNILSELDRNYRYVPGGQEIKVEKLSRRPDYPLGQVQPATQLEGLAGRERRNLKLHSVFINKTMKK